MTSDSWFLTRDQVGVASLAGEATVALVREPMRRARNLLLILAFWLMLTVGFEALLVVFHPVAYGFRI